RECLSVTSGTLSAPGDRTLHRTSPVRTPISHNGPMTQTPDASSPSHRPDTVDTTSAEGLIGQMKNRMGTLSDKMGIELLEVSAERVVATMPVEGNTQPYGLLHGGASVVLAESLGSIGAAVHGHPDRFPVGVDINATHHR